MDQHPIPRQITTFEFKLIGFMTVRQFGYVLLGGIFAYGAFLIIPIFLINIVLAVAIFSIGAALAFVPINDRPLDVFLQNLYKRIGSPTQFTYKKENAPLKILDALYFEENPHIVIAHVDSKEKLTTYLASKNSPQPNDAGHEQRIQGLLSVKQTFTNNPSPSSSRSTTSPSSPHGVPLISPKSSAQPQPHTLKHPFFTGIVFNNRHIPLPGIMLYIKEKQTGNALRILKTNPHGVFATFNPLPDGEYLVEIVDTGGGYSFSPTTILINNQVKPYFEFSSKETL